MPTSRKVTKALWAAMYFIVGTELIVSSVIQTKKVFAK